MTTAPYVPPTDAALEQLAQDIVGGQVFHSVYNGHSIDAAHMDLGQIFMPMAFADDDMRQWMRDSKINAVYEYLSKAGPIACNGMPGFFSCQFLSVDDSQRLHQRVTEIADERARRLEAANT